MSLWKVASSEDDVFSNMENILDSNFHDKDQDNAQVNQKLEALAELSEAAKLFEEVDKTVIANFLTELVVKFADNLTCNPTFKKEAMKSDANEELEIISLAFENDTEEDMSSQAFRELADKYDVNLKNDEEDQELFEDV